MKCFQRLLAGLFLVTITHSAGHAIQRDPSLFIEPPGLETDIQFWVRIYSQVNAQSGLLHDSRNLGVVYEEIGLPRGLSNAARERYVEKKKKKYRAALRKLAQGKRENLSARERRVLGLFPPDVSDKTLLRAAKRIRFQLGQSDQFRGGLIRAGAYADHIERSLNEMDLPPQLAVLPHVESSYTPEAYSRVGAVGLWQFTRATGRRFMRVDQVVDERRDPYTATLAAARLLAQNRRSTGTWPLAVTAYNHGASGMRRATRKLGHSDIEGIVRDYRSRTFGFASRNFYVEFLAASRIAENPSLYFGPLILDSPIQYETKTLPFYASAAAVSTALGVDLSRLKASNPALLSPVWNGLKRIPEGFEIRIPRSLLSQPMSEAFATIPRSERFASQTRDSYHIVRRGETLSRIAQKYRVPIGELQNLNNLRNRNRIRVGQKLRLPIEHASSSSSSGANAAISKARSDGRYTVRQGDHLTSIALRLGVDEWELAQANGIRNRNRIYAGQVLRLPGPADVLATATPATPAPQKPATSPVPSPEATAKAPPKKESRETDFEAKEPLDSPILLADPSDYLVGPNDTIEVQFGETLGHYAEWLDMRAQQLRVINGLSFGEALPIHSRLRLDFSRVSRSLFEKQRIDFQRGIQEEYFSEREIIGTTSHKLKRGDSIWVLAHQRFKIPLWLLQQYNPDIDFETASAGVEIIAPRVRRHPKAELP